MSAATASEARTSGLTWEEFLALPDDDALRHAELVDGEVVVAPPSDLHQLVVLNLVALLRSWCRQEPGRGELTMEPAVQVTPRRGFLPDVDEMWLVDPDEPAVLVLRRPEGGRTFEPADDLEADGVVTSPLLPGLEIRVRDLISR